MECAILNYGVGSVDLVTVPDDIDDVEDIATIHKLQKEVDDLYFEVDTLTNLALGSNITK